LQIHYDPNRTPQTFHLETQRWQTFKARSKISVNNLDIFAYVNSKFLYVEKHIKTQLTLHQYNGTKACVGETNISERSISSIAPDEMVDIE